jgi:phage-related protein
VVNVLKVCRRELERLPEEVRGDLADVLARLDAGLVLTIHVLHAFKQTTATTSTKNLSVAMQRLKEIQP